MMIVKLTNHRLFYFFKGGIIIVSGIYKITNKITGEIYVGATGNVKKRLWAHKHGYTHLKKFIKKWGVENFTFELIEECSPENLRDKERYYVKLFDSKINGMNSTDGGERGSINTTGYFNVCKDRTDYYVQGYIWAYHYHDGGKRKKIRRIDLNDLKDEVLSRGLKWEIINEENAKQSDVENKQSQYINNHNVKNNTGLYAVSKCKSDSTLSGIIYRYNYIEEGKQAQLSSVKLEDLEKKVRTNGLEWKIIDENKYKLTYEEYELNKDKHVDKNGTGFYHVWKINDKHIKQGFNWIYWFYDNGVRKHISRRDLLKLKEEVEKRGLLWEIIDEDEAKKSLITNQEECFDLKNSSNNSSGFYHVFKEKSNHYAQGYIWVYHYTTDDGKKKKIRRVNLDDLKEEVLSRGMKWEVLN